MLGGCPAASLMDDLHTHGQPPHGGWPSYVRLTFLALDDSMDELEMVWFLVHHHHVSKIVDESDSKISLDHYIAATNHSYRF